MRHNMYCKIGEIRRVIRRDLAQILDIERAGFNSPWPEAKVIRFLRRHNSAGYVFAYDETVVGYLFYQLFKTRYRIINFAVHRHFRRKGIATKLIHQLTSNLCSGRRTSIDLEIRETNLEGQLFLKSCGFLAKAIVESPYSDTDEDAYLMRYRI